MGIYRDINDYITNKAIIKFYKRYRSLSKSGWLFAPRKITELGRNRVLVLSPHFDDDIIGCAGALYKHVLNGDKVTVVYFTDGTRIYHRKEKQLFAGIRKEEAKKATRIIGISELIFLDEPEGRLKASPKLITRLTKIIREKSPTLIYLPWFLDNHIDHIIVNEIFLKSGERIKEKFNCCAYEVWTPLMPNCIVDISEHISKKEEALKQFRSQLKHIDYVRTTLGLNKYRTIANLKGKGYAEAFLKLSRNEYIKLMRNTH